MLFRSNVFNEIKIIKIDTDGYDFQIINGAKELIGKNSPVLFFEYDPHFWCKNNHNCSMIFDVLEGMNYHNMILYNNFGDYIMSTNVENKNLLNEITEYYSGREGKSYLDICIFHKADTDLFNEITVQERKFFRDFRKF